MISERTLKKWRKEALEVRQHRGITAEEWMASIVPSLAIPQAERILRLTQELLDQHLLNK